MENYTQEASDWRRSLRRNNQKTVLVIGIFFVIYLSIGVLVDLFVTSNRYPNAPLSDLFNALITLRLFPLATVVMFTVASISLIVTFSLYDKIMLMGTEYHEITPTTASSNSELQLYNVVEEMKIAAGLRFMPRVFIIDADYMNAFASGYSEKSAMVAITRGLMEKLNREELQAVMAHELSHIRHMDIKLTLMASVLANIILIVLDLFFYNALFSRQGSNNRNREGLAAIIILLRYLMPVINILLLLYLSRTREYMADAGCVQLLRDNQPLASALMKIQQDHSDHKTVYEAAYSQTPHENVRREAYIFDPIQAGFESMSSLADIFSTHPSLKDRLAAIGIRMKD